MFEALAMTLIVSGLKTELRSIVMGIAKVKNTKVVKVCDSLARRVTVERRSGIRYGPDYFVCMLRSPTLCLLVIFLSMNNKAYLMEQF